MPEKPAQSTRRKRRSWLSLGALAVAALGLALAAVLGVVVDSVAIDGCLALALLGALSYAAEESGLAARRSESALVCSQLAGALLVLAWLSFRAGDTSLPIGLLYVLALAYGALQLGRFELAMLAAFALVTNGVALFMLIDHGGKLALPAVALQLAMLLLAFAWLVYAAGTVLRLRARLAAARSRLHEFEREANERASRDALTGVYHQRHLTEALEREIARAERIGKPLSIARIDLDRVSALNAAHGQIAGDVALRRFTAAATGALRDVDVFGRHGGKEFLAIMPDTDLKGAVVAAERVRAAVAREAAPEVDGRRHLSCSLGVAEHRKGENTRLLIGRAEAGLAYAKAAGRDQVVALDAGGKPILVEAA
jgi:diguanylate cyclase (GGDEF)-like protein